MSASEARKVVGKAVRDETFRSQLFSDPDAALAGYDLTAEEKSALRGIPAETLDDFANNLDDRISMSLINSYFTFAGPEMSGTSSFAETPLAFEGDYPQINQAGALVEGQGDEFARGPHELEQGDPLISRGGAHFAVENPEMNYGYTMLESDQPSITQDAPSLQGAEMEQGGANLEGAGAEITGGARNENWITRLVAALGLGGASSDDARKFY